MMVFDHHPFGYITQTLTHAFVHQATLVDVGEWQSLDISAKHEMVTHELLNVSVCLDIPDSISALADIVKPNLPWAEEHFQERVSGIPFNPPPSHVRWPFARRSNEEFVKEKQFSHTYPERMWPKQAGNPVWSEVRGITKRANRTGIRYGYGDLMDVVKMLEKSPLTRQAFLPIWFPEDTGAVHGERVPCTLGYHFIVRYGQLHCVYYIRSCDFLRHFRDDVYMAARLDQWMAEKLNLMPGKLTMHITSFHVFAGDLPRLRRELDQTNQG